MYPCTMQKFHRKKKKNKKINIEVRYTVILFQRLIVLGKDELLVLVEGLVRLCVGLSEVYE